MKPAALTKRQRRRIADNIARRQAPAARTQGQGEQGQVIAQHGEQLVVADSAGAAFVCYARRHIGAVVCGDWVLWEKTVGKAAGVITGVTARRSLLARPGFGGKVKPIAANISLLCVVIAVEPPPSEALLDRYLVVAEDMAVPAVIVCSKVDLLGWRQRWQWRRRFKVYADIGYPLVFASSVAAPGVAGLRRWLQGNRSILVGQSGVGKSSLINALIPDIALKVGVLSGQGQRGRHTTSQAQLFRLPFASGHIIDSPGVRDFSLQHLSGAAIAAGFVELRPWLGQCRYSNCSHQAEAGCALRAAVKKRRVSQRRLDSFLALQGSSFKQLAVPT